jgi:hypothetical protein
MAYGKVNLTNAKRMNGNMMTNKNIYLKYKDL